MISRRMSAICSLVNNANTVADVGCDHGYVAIELIRSHKAKRAICSDVKKAPLSKAKLHISEALLDDYIECRLSDGLNSYNPGEADTVIIAGMGGPLIQKILENASPVVKEIKQFIFSPQSDIESFRRYLYENNIYIDEETIVKEDDKYYFIMRALHCSGNIEKLTDIEFKYGRNLLAEKNQTLKEFLDYENSQLNKLLVNLMDKNVTSRIVEVKRLLKDNLEALSLYEM